MKAGKLSHRIRIEEPPPEALDEYGHNDETRDWTEVATVWGQVTPLSGRELWRAQQVQADVSHLVSIRYRDGITSRMRLVHDDRTLNIGTVVNVDEDGVELQLMCKEVV